MRAKAGYLLIICLFFLVASVSGHIPDTSTITSSNPWAVANGADQTTITVMVSNSTLGSMVANVEFMLDDPIYGTMSPVIASSDATGKATSTFKVTTKSGVAVITARITSHDGYIVTKTLNQNIDHDSPYYAYFTHPLNGTVATEVPFNIIINDRWGNPVDDRKQVIPSDIHTISLHIHGPAPDDCGFVTANATPHDISSTLGINGNASLVIRLTRKAGPNNILMNAFGSIPDKLEWIDADTNGIPFIISQAYSPSGSPPSLPADGTSEFTIVYSLLDRYDNPTKENWIWMNTSIPGEEFKLQSNSQGQITITYGKRPTIGVINITATAISNTTVTISQDVEFTSTAATNMEIMANPETMTSRDVDPLIISDISASVTDIMGNPVENETVTFTMSNTSYSGNYSVISGPSLITNTAITDADGLATVTFVPGGFTTNSSDPNYSSTASGNCTITAHWGTLNKPIMVSWKNYPYLSVKTSVNPQTIQVNQTVDVTIAFKGDGWALQPKPIDVVLCTDRSGSMLYDNPDRMYSIREAAKVFVENMSTLRDTVGLVTFGRSGYIDRPGYNSGIAVSEINNVYSPYSRTYGDYATVDRTLIGGISGFNSVKNNLSSILPDHGTPMRYAVYKSVNEIKSRGRAGSIKAIILLSDGDYNWYGDPLARGTASTNSATSFGDLTTSYKTFTGLGSGQFSNQNMSVFAGNNSIRIYSIAFANSISTSGKYTLESLALSTGGKYYEASATDIADIYSQIAGDLKADAGVNTNMIGDFQNVNVTGVSVAGAQVYDYIPNSTASTRILWQDGVTNVTNQSADWSADNKLDFAIGTIRVGETWEATFRLKVKQSGSIDVFGMNSLVSFNNGTSTLTLPHTFLTVVPDLNATGIKSKTLDLSNLLVTENGEIKALLPVMWNTTYSGNKTVTENVYYSIDDGPWVMFTTKTIPGYTTEPILKEYVNYAQLDVTKLPPGGYKIKVYATVDDAPDAWIGPTDVKTVGGQGKVYLRLE